MYNSGADKTMLQNGGHKLSGCFIESENYKFFQHKECEFFPCHKVKDVENFNCLFCYCPLYALGDKCGGNFKYNEKGFKDCTDCTLPHRRSNFDYVLGKYNEILDIVKTNHEEGYREEISEEE
jgi:Zn-finger protein